jgi:hypothetical protein
VLIVVAGILAALLGPASTHGQTAWYEGFEGPQPTWHDAGGDARYQIQEHRRLQGQAHTGEGCERLTVAGTQGTYAYLSHEVGRPRVIDELMPTVWIKSDRPGLQILARLVLPRTADPRSGRPVSTLVRGSTYTKVGHWQQLRIEGLPQLLARQIRVLRTQLGPGVDGREAYLDRILLNVYGGPGLTNVWIDDLDVAGFVAAGPTAEAPAIPPGSPRSAGVGRPDDHSVALVGSVLMVEGRPFFPRIIRHQGEALAFLKRLRFNAVWLARLPSPEVLGEADELGLWLVCPPPRPTGSDLADGRAPALAAIGPEYDRVLAWDLGRGLCADQLEATRRWAGQVRSADRHRGRPLICLPESDLRGFSRQVDVLLLERRPLGTSLELADYATWIRRQPRLARPGTPIWTSVQTQPAAALCRQLAALDPSRPPPLAVASEQIHLLAYTAVASGSRALVFQSHTPLDADDPQTRGRAMALELLNLELQLLEPWAAAGSLVAGAEGSRPELTGSVLRANRSRLLIPIWSGPGAQFTAGQSAGNQVWFLVPGVPETNKAYQLTPGGLLPTRDQQRETGGVRITLEEFGLTGPILFAHDRLVIDSLARRSALIGPQAAEMARNLAVGKFHTVRELAAELAPRTPAPAGQSTRWIAAARSSLQQCDGYLAAKEYRAAYLRARRAMRSLRLVERAYWERATEGLASPVTSPGAVSFATLPWHWSLIDRIASSRPGPNRLPGGGFEDLHTMLEAGWNHFRYGSAELQTAADLVGGAARAGNSGLRLKVRAADPENPPAVVETPPLWITSPALPVEAGQLVCIQGWVQVPEAVTGSVDGLLILDSLSGETLARRIRQTNGWRQFTLWRMATESGRMTVTFALTGLGEVWIDDVTVRYFEPAGTGGLTRLPGAGHPPR